MHLRWSGHGLVDNTVAESVFFVEWPWFVNNTVAESVSVVEQRVTQFGGRTPSCLDFTAEHHFTFFHSGFAGPFMLWMQGQPMSEVATLLFTWVLCDGFPS